ncbi:MAG: exodeoxyribonuclease VII small subunit [Defluviitaleaceae bacterium]|nr:exodeoxyribonuclease VII small subunit [Defluviitaleaceae bacterium]
MPAKKKISFEQKLQKLEEIVEQVENADTPLEKSLALYKDGIALAKECGDVLRVFEEEVLVLQREADGFSSEPFAAGR